MSSAPPPIPAPKSELSRLTGVFFSPKDTFPDIVMRPRWWVPVILMMIVSAVFVSLFSQRVGWEKTVRTAIERNPRMDQMTVAQKEQAIAVGTRVTGYIGYAAPIFTPIGVVVVAAVLIFVFNTLLAADLRFKSLLGIVAYGFLPSLIAGLLSILVMYLKDPDDFDIQRPLMFNLGSFLPEGTPRWAVVFGTSLDLFTFWTIALMAIGIHAASRRISTGKAFFGILMPWFVVVVLRVMQTIAFG